MNFNFCGILTIVFIVLKLTGHIDWNWIWVVSPIWISYILFVSLVFIASVINKR